jgi:hypothetical protein
METIESTKKRDSKEIEKVEEEKDIQPHVRTHKQPKKFREHIITEKSSLPITEEDIAERFKGSYLENMHFNSYKPLTSVKGRAQCPKCKTNRKFY